MTSVGAFFCGIGGFCFGFEKHGFSTRWANDYEKNVELTYQHNFPDVNFLVGDIRELAPQTLEPVDVVHGGFPCQSFSTAGARSGFNDPKGMGQLFDVMMDKIESMTVLPKVLVLENVPFIRIGESGTWFEHIKSRIKAAGYWFSDENALILDARAHGGLPQRRERLFMLAVRKDYCDLNPFHAIDGNEEITPLSSLLKQHHNTDKPYFIDKDSKYHEEMWTSAVESGKLVEPFQLVQYRKTWARIIEPNVCPTLTQNMGAGGHNVPFYLDMDKKQFRKLSVNQCLSLQGFPDQFSFPESLTDSACYRMIGNSVSPKVSQILAEKISTFLEEHDNGLKLAV